MKNIKLFYFTAFFFVGIAFTLLSFRHAILHNYETPIFTTVIHLIIMMMVVRNCILHICNHRDSLFYLTKNVLVPFSAYIISYFIAMELNHSYAIFFNITDKSGAVLPLWYAITLSVSLYFLSKILFFVSSISLKKQIIYPTKT